MTHTISKKIPSIPLALAVLIIALLLSTTQVSSAASLHLGWNANTEADLSGYKVYYGTSSGSYGAPINVGNVTDYLLTGLTEGVTYYISITAYDTANNESEKATEITGVPPDTQSPTISITSPTSSATYTTTNNTITLSGSASDNVGVTQVTWSNSRGGSGTATGTTSWSVSSVTLQSGDNLITVTARDAAVNTGTDTLTVTYTPPDTQNPTITITSPTSSATYSTTNSTITLSGTASDSVGVTQVTWSNSRGGSGTATGTTSWSVSTITLQSGDNLITVTARDAAVNTGTDTLTVTYTPPDTQNPTITITSPTSSSTYATSNWVITLGGTASDNKGVTSISWSNNRGGFGVASGTTSWSCSNISLAYGENVITVVARDEAGNTGSDTITINYTLPPGSYTQEFGEADSSDHFGTIQDTFINMDHDRNYSSTQLNTYTWPVNRAANAIIMKWDLSSLPPDVYIQNATLSLYLMAAGGDNPYNLTVHKIINHDPLITECDGYTYDGINGWTASGQTPPLAQADIQSAVDSQDINTTLGYKSWNAKQIIKDWMNNPATNYGMLINSDTTATADSYRNFAATENEDSTRRPKLVVTFFVGNDTENPTVTITNPVSSSTYVSATSTITMAGTASDNLEVTQVTWSNSRGGSGTATGTTSWSVSSITLQEGDNVITVTVRDAASNTGTDTLTVTYTPPDTQNPTITITSPTSSSTYATNENTITLSGTASDNRGVTTVTWSNSRGGSGTASGTTSWSIATISLPCGQDSIITVTAHDATGNTATDALTINVRPCKPFGLGFK